MEKQRTDGGIEFFRRLLILLPYRIKIETIGKFRLLKNAIFDPPFRMRRGTIFAIASLSILLGGGSLYAEWSSDLQKLRVTPPVGALYSGNDYMFSLIIPDVKPSDVQADSPEMPPGVSVVSMRRTDYAQIGIQSGTEIDIWLSFRDARIYTLPPLRVRIKGRPYEIPFSDVNIEQNPASTFPHLIVKFENGTELTDGTTNDEPLFTLPAGEKILFTLYVQYAVQAIRFSWQAPKDALLTELWRYEIAEGTPRASLFTADPIPVALFEWQPLVGGNTPIPDMQLTVSAYSGARVKLSPPAGTILVVPSLSVPSDEGDSNESYFSYAFSEVGHSESEHRVRTLSESDCETLAMLHSAERHAFFPWKAASARRAFEAKLGIASGKAEPSVAACMLFAAATLVLALLCAVLFVLKKRAGAYAVLGCVLVVFSFAVASAIRLSGTYGIFKGGDVRFVPDESSGLVSPIASGERVSVEETAGKWVYIQYGTTGGWVASSSVVPIR